MKNSSSVIGLIIVALLLVGLFALLRSDGSENSGEENTNKAEQKDAFSGGALFELEDYEGNLIRSHDFEQEVLVVNAWASWCPFCVNELPDFAELAETFPDDVAVIAINRAEPLRTAKNYSDNLNLGDSITFLVDPEDAFYRSIGGFSMPETLFLDKNGEIVLHKRGPLSFDEMKTIIEPLIEN